jgi:hypothetical protein
VSQLTLDVNARLLSIEAKEYSWHFTFTEGIRVTSETLWRLVGDGRVMWVSGDHLQVFGLPQPVDLVQEVQSAIADRPLTHLQVDDKGDLLLSFAGDDVELQFLITSGGYESFRLEVSDRLYVATGGGRLVEVPT